ncbi:hypothetical protein HCJ66_11015 [Listeria sp. FSL L7-1582]|uniref:hypothetical protein n=1 Tax=Listeria portnoyi TaxID=2713504 RepID=UPI00164D3A68|nr:hypothetical protein [Listeria portnoyi]MBC6310070.1 hypothetical protein [Listeria portnoyi]
MAGKSHDFSQASIDQLATIVNDVEDDGQLGFLDWVNDPFISVPEIQDSLDNLNEYHKAVIDKHDIGKQAFDEILKDVESVDKAYERNFESTLNELEGFQYKLENIAQLITPSVISTSKDILGSIVSYTNYRGMAIAQYGDYLKGHPDDLDRIMAIVEYEALHPESVKKTNEFLSPLEMQDVIGIKYLIYTAEEPQRSLCLKYMSEYEIKFLSKEDIEKDVSSYFSPGDNSINVNMRIDRYNERGSYYTFFHEMGHAIDNYYGKEHGTNDSYSSIFKTKGKTLSEYNIQDVGKNVEDSLDKLLKEDKYSGLSDGEKQKMINNISQNIMQQDKNYDNLTQTEQNLQDKLKLHYADEFAGADAESPSDIYGGVTNFTIKGDYGHQKDPYYWFNKSGDVVRTTNKESFAEFFGRKVTTGDTSVNGLGSIDTYLPESSKHMEEMLESMR